jgi:hypothetical protein
MKKVLFIVSLVAVTLLGTSCRSNKCNCPHFEKNTSEKAAEQK